MREHWGCKGWWSWQGWHLHSVILHFPLKFKIAIEIIENVKTIQILTRTQEFYEKYENSIKQHKGKNLKLGIIDGRQIWTKWKKCVSFSPLLWAQKYARDENLFIRRFFYFIFPFFFVLSSKLTRFCHENSLIIFLYRYWLKLSD